MTTEVLYLQTGETSARQDRWLTDRIFSEGVSDVQAGQLLVTERAGGANMSVDVAPGDAIVTGDTITDQGKYQVRLTAGVNVLIEGAPATGTRVDLVVLKVHDSTADGGAAANDGAAVEVVTGTVDAGAPAVPDSALPLAEVTVAAGAGSIFAADIADRRTQLNATTLQVGTQAEALTLAEREALPAVELFPGRLVYESDTGALEVYDGSGWVSDSLAALFGDGSDGDVTITADTELSRTMHYDNLTLAPGVRLDTAGCRVFVRGTLTFGAGSRISSNGRPGAGVTGSTSMSYAPENWSTNNYGGDGAVRASGADLAYTLYTGSESHGSNGQHGIGLGGAFRGYGSSAMYNSYGQVGGYGGGGGGAIAGNQSVSSYPNLDGSGTTGGQGYRNGASGAGAGGGAKRFRRLGYALLDEVGQLYISSNTYACPWFGGAGGGGGATGVSSSVQDVAYGGCGGGGGGVVMVFAAKVTGPAVFEAKGGAGGKGGDHSEAGGGGGGGGGGGAVFVLSEYALPAGYVIDVSGGPGGAAGLDTTDGSANGGRGADGATGLGVVYLLKQGA